MKGESEVVKIKIIIINDLFRFDFTDMWWPNIHHSFQHQQASRVKIRKKISEVCLRMLVKS